MLRPNKHSDPDLTVLPVAGKILERLRTDRIAPLPVLREEACGDRLEKQALFVPAIHTLYLLGLVAYRSKSDSFEYVGG